MALPAHVDDAIFAIRKRQNSNSMSFLSYIQVSTELIISKESRVVNRPVTCQNTVERSGRGRRKRAYRQIGALNGCLWIVVDADVNMGDAIQCRQVQVGCETRWVHFGYTLSSGIKDNL